MVGPDPVSLHGEDAPRSAPRTPPSLVVGALGVANTPVSLEAQAASDFIESVAMGAPVCSSSDDDGGPATATEASRATI